MVKESTIMIANNVRRFRGMAGMTQAELGASLGITFQQIQKYETGKNRIASCVLLEIALLLGLNISSFFMDEFMGGDVIKLPLTRKEGKVIKAVLELENPYIIMPIVNNLPKKKLANSNPTPADAI